MGNQIVIPASKDWWSSVLNSKNYLVKGQIHGGSLFLKFICTDKSKRDQLLVKAYQSEHLSTIPYYDLIKKYFEIISKSDIPMVRFFDIIENSDSVFFIRRKFGQPLSDVISQEPSLYPEEKFWITYQLFVALDAIHKINIFHGDLKPNNILFVPSGRVYIVDPAPFKPYALDQYHPHYYYYFFANDDSSGCFLAPERIIGSLSLSSPENNIPVSDLISSDLFSLGCIIAYMYLNGESLFTLDTVRRYGKGEYTDELETTLSSINDKKIIDLIKGLISLDPSKRRKTFDSSFKTIFPSDFKAMHEKFYPKQDYFILNQKPNSELFDYSTISSNIDAKKDFPKILTEFNLLKKKTATVGAHMIFYNYFGYRALKAKSVSEIRFIIDFIIDFSRDFDDESKLMRVVPLFMKLLDYEVISISRKVLFGIVEIFQSMKSISSDLNNVIKDSVLHLFRQKFLKEGLPLGAGFPTESEIDFYTPNGSRNNTMSSFNTLIKNANSIDSYVAIFAEFLPYFSYEVFRLQPEYLKDCLVTFNIPKNQLDVFKIFSNSMKKVSKNGSFFFYYNCSMFLFEFFNNEVDFKIEYLSLLIEIYSNAKDDEKTYFIDDLIIIIPHIIRSICPNSNISFSEYIGIYSQNAEIKSYTIDSMNSTSKIKPDLPPEWDGPDCLKWEKYTCYVLQFFICLLEKRILEENFTLAIANIMVYLLNSKSDKVYYLLDILMNYFTPYAKQMPLYIFISDRIKSFMGSSKINCSNGLDPIKLKEKKKYSSSERIKFGNPLVTIPLVQKYKKLFISPRFIQSKRSGSECITGIALDKNFCIYVSGNDKLRFFHNDYPFLEDENKVHELNYTKQNDAEREKARPGGDGRITHIDLLSYIDNCCFSQHCVVAYEKGRIDCIDLSKEYSFYSKQQTAEIAANFQLFSSSGREKTSTSSSLKKKKHGVSRSITQPSNPASYTKKDIVDRNYNSKAIQLFCENKNDILTSFSVLKKRCCLASGRWNGGIEIIDIRINPTPGEGYFGLVGGEGFKFDSLVSLSTSPVNDDFLYAGFSSGIVTAIDLRVGLPVSETLTLPAFNVWPVACPSKNKTSCIAVYDGESTVQFISESSNEIIQSIHGKSFVGTTFNGGIILADDFSASYYDLINEDDNFFLYDGSVRKFNPNESKKGKILSFPDFDLNELVSSYYDYSLDSASSFNTSNSSSFCSSISMGSQNGELENDCADRVECQVRKNIASVHMHKSPVKCISKFENLFVTGDSSGFVNMWSVCSPEETRTIATYT